MRARTPIVLLTLLAAAAGDVPARAQLLPPGSPNAASAEQAPDAQAGYEVLTRGPVHEAFAEVAAASPEPGVVIPRQPPQPIEEQPPETRPEGENIVWLPGYWHWDDDRQDFLWVSGVWRAVPPGREWTPGYWREADGGYQWVAGYWADRGAASAEVQYLPPPPETLEAGPTSPAPGDNYVWSPGCWMWNSARYVWQPGYWIVVQPNWIWIPHYYVWTPYGCVLAGGYLDYVVPRRGLLFAPIYFTSPIYAQPAFAYRPSYCIGFDVLTAYLFARPRYCHYYFGDYFAPRYAGIGYRPWFQSSWGRANYDPLFAYYRHVNRRRDRDWDRRLADRFNYFRDHEAARPPRTLQAQQAALASAGRGGAIAVPGGPLQIAQSVDRFRQSARDRYGVQLGQASGRQLEQATERREAWKNLQASRRRAETAEGGAKALEGGRVNDPRRARWNVENPIARDVPNVRVPDMPRVPRPSTGRGLAQPGGGNPPGDLNSPSTRGRVRPDLGNRDRGQVGRDRSSFGRSPRDNAITNPFGPSDPGSRRTLRPTPRPGIDAGDSLPGVERSRRPPSELGRSRPPFEGTPQGGRARGGEGSSGPSLSTPGGSPRTAPDRSLRRGPSGLESNQGPRDNALRVPRTTRPNISQPTLPQPGAASLGRGNWQRPSAASGGGDGRSNLGRQTLQRPVTPPSFGAPSGGGAAIQRSAPTPRQLPGGGGAGPGGAQFRRPTAGSGAVAAPSGAGSGPQFNRGAAGRGRGRGERED